MEAPVQELLKRGLPQTAPGTALREGLDAIIAGRTGALIVIGDASQVDPICDGGFEINTPFTAQRLFELSKMDGAIIADSECETILKANVHLVPDPTLETCETGMRHRTAERVSRETDALVIAVSQRREIVNLYFGGTRLTLEDIEVVLAKANQALQTLQRYRQRLDEVLDKLTTMEFEDLVTLGDVAEAIARFEMVRRISSEVNRYVMQLGTEGRLVRMQAEELTAGVGEEYQLLVRDYAADSAVRKVTTFRARLGELPPDQLHEPEIVASAIGYPAGGAAPESHVSPRGYRVLSRVPQLPASVQSRIVERFGSLPGILRASHKDLDGVDGVGERRANAIASGLARARSSSVA